MSKSDDEAILILDAIDMMGESPVTRTAFWLCKHCGANWPNLHAKGCPVPVSRARYRREYEEAKRENIVSESSCFEKVLSNRE